MSTRWMSALFVVCSLTSSAAVAAEIDTAGSLSAGAQLSDTSSPTSLLQAELRPSFGPHGFAATRAAVAASADVDLDEVRFAAYSYTAGNVAYRVGGGGYDYKPLIDTRTAHIDIGGVDLSFQRKLSKRIGLFAAASATLSLAEWTQSSQHPMTDIGFELFLCSSASRLETEVGLELDDAWALIASAGVQGDPLHFTDGSKCLGDPPAFSSKQQVGVTLRWTGESLYGTLRGGWERERLHVDRASEYHTGATHDHRGDAGHDIMDVASESALVANAMVGIRW